MIVRNLDANGDWTFGAGKNNYRTDDTNDLTKSALAQCIKTRIMCFLGDCFFDLTAGINWPFYLGARNRQDELQMEVAQVIINTENVTSISDLQLEIDQQRRITLSYTVETALGQLNGELNYTM